MKINNPELYNTDRSLILKDRASFLKNPFDKMKSTIQTIFRISMALVIVLQLSQCKTSKTVSQEKDNTAQAVTYTSSHKVIIDESFTGTDLGDRFKIDSISLKRDILDIYVQFSGGCKDHSFDLYSNKHYMKSLPLQLKLFLTHKNNGDACRKIVKETLHFNISDIQYPGKNTLVIKINDHKIPITYKY